jgi:hypothetical protein
MSGAAYTTPVRGRTVPAGATCVVTVVGDSMTLASGPPGPTADQLCRLATGRPSRRALRVELARLRRLRKAAKRGSHRR